MHMTLLASSLGDAPRFDSSLSIQWFHRIANLVVSMHMTMVWELRYGPLWSPIAQFIATSLHSLPLNFTPPTMSRSLHLSLGARCFSCLRKKRRLSNSLICSAAYVLGPTALQWSWESPSPPINTD